MEILTAVCIIEHLSTGGEEMLVTELMPSLRQLGFKPVVITFMPGKLDGKLTRSGVNLIVINADSKLKRLIQLIKILNGIKPDLVHTRLFSGGFWGRIAALCTRVPVIIHTHGGFTFIEKKIKRIPVEKLLFYITDQTVAVSQGVKKHLKEAGNLKGNRITVIHNGLHLSPFSNISPRKVKKSVRLICVGRLEHVKGHDIAIRAVSLLPKEVWKELIIAGEGSKYNELKELASSSGIAHKVRFLGNRKDIPSLLSSADIFVSPSRSEGLPVAVLEAMAAARPVIATDISGHREALGETGIYVIPESPESLSQGIQNMISTPGKVEQSTFKARGRVFDHFNFNVMLKAHASLYRNLVEKKKK